MGKLVVRTLRTASILICGLAIAAFLVFAANETKAASSRQQLAISAATASTTSEIPATAAAPRKSEVHRLLDEASETFTAPFEATVPAADGAWTRHGAGLLMTLVVFGFGVGYLARVLHVRV